MPDNGLAPAITVPMDVKATLNDLLHAFRRLAAERRSQELVASVEGQLETASPELAAELRGFLNLVVWYSASESGRFAEGLSEAIRYIDRLRRWDVETPIDWLLSVAGFSMGMVGQLERGLQWVFEAREMAQARRDTAAHFAILTNQGSLYSVSGDYEAAEKVFVAAQALAPGRSINLITLINNRAFSLVTWARSLPAKDPCRETLASRALEAAEEALAMTGPRTDARWLAWGKANRAHALALLGREEEADMAYREVLPLAAPYRREAVTAMAGHARLLTETGRHQEARDLLAEAFAKAPEDLLDTTRDLVLEAWVDLEKAAGNAEAVALWFSRRLQRLEAQYRVRLSNVIHQAELFESIERDRKLERQLAAAEVALSKTKARESLIQDLHDGFGSQLAIARIRAERGELSNEALIALLDDCIADLYVVVDSVGNPEGDLGNALRMLRNRLSGRLRSVATTLHWKILLDDVPPLGQLRTVHVLRIVQEALANVFKHAQAANAWVEASRVNDGFLITVRDDGVGLSDPSAKGTGLQNMRGRARTLAATLDIDSSRSGTVVRIAVPL